MKQVVLLLLISLLTLTTHAYDLPPTAPRIEPIKHQKGKFLIKTLPPFTAPVAANGVVHELTYDVSGLPQGLQFIPASRTIYGYPAEQGALSFSYIARDRDAFPETDNRVTVTIIVEKNLAPIAPEFASQYIQDGAGFSFKLPRFTDPENENITYELGYYGDMPSDPMPSGMHYDVNTRTLSGVYNSYEHGKKFDFVYRARDESGNVDRLYFSLVIKPRNPPIAPIVNALTLQVNKPVMLQLPAFTDAMNGQLTYAIIKSLPDGLSFVPTTRVLYGTPATLGSKTVYFNARNSQGVSTAVALKIHVVANATSSSNSNARLAAEPVEKPHEWTATVLGNPVITDTFEVELRQAQGQSVAFQLIDSNGRTISEEQQLIQQEVERVRIRMGAQPPGVYALKILSDQQAKTLKIVR